MSEPKLTLEQLKGKYVGIVLQCSDACPLGPGNRVAFWASGDGKRTRLYRTDGEEVMVWNDTFKVSDVLDSEDWKILDGRLLRIPAGKLEFESVGPIYPEGVKDDDLPLKSKPARKATKVKPNTVPALPKAKDKFLFS